MSFGRSSLAAAVETVGAEEREEMIEPGGGSATLPSETDEPCVSVSMLALGSTWKGQESTLIYR